MTYNLNGKNIRIPDKTIENYMKTLELSKEEAIEMWLEDEGYLDNEEQLELEQKAKENKITQTIHGAGDGKKKNTKPKTVKVSDEKQRVFTGLKEFLTHFAQNNEGMLIVLKENKLFELQIGKKKFKIDLIEQRPPKK